MFACTASAIGLLKWRGAAAPISFRVTLVSVIMAAASAMRSTSTAERAPSTFALLAEGKAIRPSDIDVVWVNGYGWPVYRGGPMHFADSIGLDKVVAKLKEFQATMGDAFAPAPLLEKMAAEGKTFGSMR